MSIVWLLTAAGSQQRAIIMPIVSAQAIRKRPTAEPEVSRATPQALRPDVLVHPHAGGGHGSPGLTVFAATAVAWALGGVRIVIAQAAAAAILTAVVTNGEAGTQRLVGARVALLFTQQLFSPERLALLRRAEAAALADMAEALRLTVRALNRDDDDVAEQAMSHLRELRDRRSELGGTRAASVRVARRSAVWRSQIAPVVRETEDAGRLDLHGGSGHALTRVANAAIAQRRCAGPC